MMTKIDVVNMAYGRLNMESVASLDDNSPQAEAAAEIWRNCFEGFLQEYGWSFAKREHQPSRLADKPLTWSFAYALPDDFVRTIAVTLPGKSRLFGCSAPRRPALEYEIIRPSGSPRPALGCDAADILLAYVSSDTPIERFSPAAAGALSASLALRLCLIFRDSSRKFSELAQVYGMELEKAKSFEAEATGSRRLDNCGYDDSRL